MREPARELNRGFFSRIERGRPWLRLKLAASLDGRTALGDGRSHWITGEAARRDVQIAARTTQDLSIELESVVSGVSPAFFITGAALTAIAASTMTSGLTGSDWRVSQSSGR